MQEDKQLIFNYVKSKALCTVATTNGNKPEAAVLYFSASEKLEIVFATLSTSRKAKNLLNNKNVAIVFGGEDNKTVQYEGTAEQLSPEAFEAYKGQYLAKYPDAAKLLQNKDTIFFKVIPKWIRYYDKTQSPPYEFEISF